jgi:hypothetical protein
MGCRGRGGADVALVYPRVDIGRFKLGLGFNNDYMNRAWGFDLGERFYKDPEYRVRTVMEIDRAVYEDFGRVGIGSVEPEPRPSVEPFGHRFVPAMLGCPCRFGPDSEPWATPQPLSEDQVLALLEWSGDKVEAAEPMREVASQNRYLRERYGAARNLRDLGSAVNTALSLMGEELLVKYRTSPGVVRRIFRGITRLTVLCIECIERLDGKNRSEPLGLGNCTVTMISPGDYRRCNLATDRRFRRYCRRRGLRFFVHQDSGVTPHLGNYRRLGTVDAFDVGIDTDFEQLHHLFPDTATNCIIFPQWLLSRDDAAVAGELERLMETGSRFREFSFSMYEIDSALTRDRILGFVDLFTEVARRVGSRRGVPSPHGGSR